MPEKLSNHSRDNHSINMSIFYWNHVKHWMKYVETWVFSDLYLYVYGQNLGFCPYMRKYGCDFNTDRKIKIILLKVKRRSALQLTLSSLKLCRILEAVSRKVATSWAWPKAISYNFFLQKETSVVKKIVYSEPNKHTSLFKSNIFVYILEIIANRFNQIYNGQN